MRADADHAIAVRRAAAAHAKRLARGDEVAAHAECVDGKCRRQRSCVNRADCFLTPSRLLMPLLLRMMPRLLAILPLLLHNGLLLRLHGRPLVVVVVLLLHD